VLECSRRNILQIHKINTTADHNSDNTSSGSRLVRELLLQYMHEVLVPRGNICRRPTGAVKEKQRTEGIQRRER
jgi:hypothetical protein